MSCFLWTLLLLRSKRYGVPQSRSRVYILMVRADVLDVAELKALVHIITEVLPSTLDPPATLKEVTDYVKYVLEATDRQPAMPVSCKDAEPLDFGNRLQKIMEHGNMGHPGPYNFFSQN